MVNLDENSAFISIELYWGEIAMKVSFIGYGSMAESLSSRWVGKHELFIAGRDSSKAQSLASRLAQGTKAGSLVEAAEFGEVIVLATPH